MSETSTPSRIWGLAGFCALLFFGILGVGGVAVWIYKHGCDALQEHQNADAACRAWILGNAQIAQELGTPSLRPFTGSCGLSAEGDHGTADFQYTLSGPQSSGCVQVWLEKSGGGPWVVLGAVLSPAGRQPEKIGSPPAPSEATGKAN